jgi:transcriptional regulator, asnC family
LCGVALENFAIHFTFSVFCVRILSNLWGQCRPPLLAAALFPFLLIMEVDGMDRIDRKIIDILQTNARAPLKEIADRVFLSSPAVSARIAKLEKDGVLTGYQAQVAPLKLGQLVKAFINLDMDPKLKPEFYPYIQSCGNVVECNCVTGDYSMLIEVLFGTTQELDTFINHLQQFGRTRTQIVFSTPVEHRGLPVSEPEEEPAAET